MPSTRSRTPGASETSSASRVTDEGATPGGRRSMGCGLSVPEPIRHAACPPLDVPEGGRQRPAVLTAGLANNDGGAGGAARHNGCGERLHRYELYTASLKRLT